MTETETAVRIRTKPSSNHETGHHPPTSTAGHRLPAGRHRSSHDDRDRYFSGSGNGDFHPAGRPDRPIPGAISPLFPHLCGSLLLLTGILCGRLAVRYGLYPVSSTLTIPLYGLVACGILLGREYLTESVTAFILLLSTQSFFACFRNGYAIGAVFRASFFLGLLPLLYAPLLPLPLLILAAAFCFRRTLREVFVSLCGVILPFLAVCYVAWGQGANPVDIPVGLWHSFVSDSGYRIFANTPPLVPAILGIVLFIVLCAVFSDSSVSVR